MKNTRASEFESQPGRRGGNSQLSEHFIGPCRRQNLPDFRVARGCCEARCCGENPLGKFGLTRHRATRVGLPSGYDPDNFSEISSLRAAAGRCFLSLFSAVYQFSSVLARETRQNFRNTIHSHKYESSTNLASRRRLLILQVFKYNNVCDHIM